MITLTVNGKQIEFDLNVRQLIGLRNLEEDGTFLEGFADLVTTVQVNGEEVPTLELPIDEFVGLIREVPAAIVDVITSKKN